MGWYISLLCGIEQALAGLQSAVALKHPVQAEIIPGLGHYSSNSLPLLPGGF
jgi:hypothetical protein